MRLPTILLSLGLILTAACAPAATNQAAPSQATAPSATGSQSTTGEKRSANQVLRVAQVGLPASMSPGASASNGNVYGLLYDDLVVLDQKFQILPAAATSWTASDPTTWRLMLRKDLTFSNGDKLTADDVANTWKIYTENKFPGAGQLGNVADIVKVDDYTVDVKLKAQDAAMLANLSFLWVLPKNYIEKAGIDGFTAKPIGSGPYELAEYSAANMGRFKLRSNLTGYRKPIATEIVVRSLPEFTSISAGLRNNELDVAIGQFTGDQVDQAKRGDVTVQQTYVYNINGSFPVIEREKNNSPAANIKVRQAINYAVDKDAIVKQFFKGQAIAAGQLGMPDAPFWDPNIKPYPYDPAKAKQLLAEAGYPNGVKLPIGIEYTPQTANQDVMLAIQGYLRDVGIDSPLQGYELAQFLDKLYGRNGQSKGDIFITALGDGNGFDTLGNTFYGCAPKFNWYCNAEFDKLHAEAAMEPDIAKRTALLRKAAQIITGDVSHLYLIVVPSFAISTTKVKSLEYPGITNRLFDATYKVD